MRKGRAITALVVSVVLCSVFLSGCHGSRTSAGFTVPDRFDTSVRHEITFWAKNDTNIAQVEIYQSAIDSFQKLYPNISVKMRLYTDYSRLYNDVITNISTGTAPNVCITYPDHIATYKTGENTVVNLDSLVSSPAYGLGGTELLFDSPAYDEVIPEFMKECFLDESIYALPFMRSTEACFVNKTFVEKLGYELPEKLTWDFVWEVSEAAMAKDSDGNFRLNGQKVMIPFIYKSTDNMMITMLKQLDAGYSTDSGEINIFNETTAEILKNVAAHAKNGAFSTFKISSYPANFLNAGQSIFAIDSTAGATWMGTDAPNLDIAADQVVDFETVVMAIPQFNTDDPKMISQGPSVCVFNKDDSQEVLASWLFAQYLLTNDVQIAYSQTEGYVPVTSKAQNDELYLNYLAMAGEDNSEHYHIKIEAAQLLMENTEHTFTTPVFNGSASLRDAAGQMIENVTKSVRRKETVDDAYITKLFNDMTSLYRLNQIGGNTASATNADLGPLPETSVRLLQSIACAWICIIIFVVYGALKKKIKTVKK